jgi:hypothetical protein
LITCLTKQQDGFRLSILLVLAQIVGISATKRFTQNFSNIIFFRSVPDC